MRTSRRFFPLLLCLSFVACGRGNDVQTAAEIESLLSAPPAFALAGPRTDRTWLDVRKFYEGRGFRPAWFNGGAPSAGVNQLIAALREGRTHGLRPVEYGYERLLAARDASTSRWLGRGDTGDSIASLDAQFTFAFLRFGRDLREGRVAPAAVIPTWSQHDERKDDLVDRLASALSGGSIRDTLGSLAPSHAQYSALRVALAAERQRLATGAAGASAERIAALERNLDRWRWLPEDLGDTYLVVNVAAYELQVMQRDVAALSMPVVVGAPDTPTPLFSDRMTYVVFSPYWNIPESILENETLPRIADDPDYLARSGLEVVRTAGRDVETVDPSTVDWSANLKRQGLRLRQVPGPENALGLVKFVFPNHFSVYLHDTPDDDLFRRPQRALSHGCVRVQSPVDLAKFVLRDSDWTVGRIETAMHAGQEDVVKLPEPLPVYLGYWTIWTNAKGNLVTTDDPYGIDRRHAEVLAAEARRPPPPPSPRAES